MNDRLKELAEQARVDGDAIHYYSPLFAEKFAELIVKECVDTVSDCSVEYCTRPQIVSEIKEHFGVEASNQ